MNLAWSGQEQIPVSKEKVWAFINDPKSIASCLPDVLDSTVYDAHTFDATVKVALGPVRGKFKFKIALEPQSDGNRMNLKISGGGLGSVVDLLADAEIKSDGDATTILDWKGSATMRGPVATIGGRVVDAQAHRVIETTFANVKSRLTRRGRPVNAMEFFERAAELERGREAFALATVVVRRAPVSSHLGDRAIVFADGRMEGFVGGSCSRDIVCRHAVAAIRTGRPRLLQIRTDALDEPHAPDESERIVIPMGCASEGAVDVYVEPHLPPRLLLVIGATPVAHELARIGALLEGFRVIPVTSAEALREAVPGLDGAERAGAAVVVASQGTCDEAALELVLAGAPFAYVGLLASRKRAADVFGSLAQQGVATERLASVRAPVGLDIGARRPSEVAISILAEIVAAVAPGCDADAVAGVEEEAHCMHCHDDAPAT